MYGIRVHLSSENLRENGYGFLAVLFTLLAEQPRHTVGIGAVQSGMRGEQAERRPAFVNVRRSLASKRQSWLQKPKPERHRERPPRRDSDMEE